MKYSQFLQFSELLESNNVSLKEWKDNPDMKLEEKKEKSEEDTGKLDTKAGNIITKRGRARRMLNKHAKKVQNDLNKKLIEKYTKELFERKASIYKKMAQMLREKQPKEVVKALQKELNEFESLQKKQLDLLFKKAQGALQKYKKPIEGALEKKGLKETTLANLLNYWDLLTGQVEMNLFNAISKKESELIDSVIDDAQIKKIATEINKKTMGKSLSSTIQGLEGKIKSLENQIKEAEKKEGKEESEEGEPGKEEAEAEVSGEENKE